MLEANFNNLKLINKKQKVTNDTPKWDLSFMYQNIDDPQIFKDLELTNKKVDEFKEKYSSKLNPVVLSEHDLLNAILQYEEIFANLVNPVWYLELVHSTDTKDENLLAKLGKAENIYSIAVKKLNFFENNLSQIKQDKKDWILNSHILSNYKNFFVNLFAGSEHTLKNEIEELMIEKDLNGRSNWQKFRQIYESRFKFYFTENKEEKEYTLSELAVVARRSSDPETRHRASNTVLAKFKENDYVFSFIYNSLIQDYLTTNIHRRKYRTPIEKRNIQNQLSNKVVENLIKTVENNYPIAQNYWKKKANILGIKNFKSSDVYAPYPIKDEKKYSFKDAYTIIMDALENFSPKVRKMEEIMFSEGLIDAEPKHGKRGGAFCALLTPKLPSVVFSNFLGTYNDITTIMHEGGHWLHHMLISNNQTLLNSNTPLTTAETASVFFEMILFGEELKRLEKEGNQDKINAHIMEKIDSIFATAFRQIAFTKFELETYDRSLNSPLQAKEFEEIFVKEYSKLFGDAVKMTENFRYEWSYIPHFVNSPFYVYAYAFGELATIALYNKYLETENKQTFVEKYLEFLANGSRLSPKDLYLTMGIDIENPDVWNESFNYISKLINRL